METIDNRKMVIINSFEEYSMYLGKELGISNWHKIDQEQINKFADATLDHQWIHTDEEKAKREGPFGGTIAHGYLTLALIPYLWKQIVDVRNIKMEINYGIESFKFGQPVLVDNEVQLKAKLNTITNLRGVTKVIIEATLMIKNQPKPAYTGNVVFLYHFV
ncbi:acyl dehydratase [Chitinophaga polysaccharea]|uniref:Acyl dehydratase n=1 Tax=Chitinophaga polysaccharea TaxID=1293035 RepID=A0A561Q4H9_9BACT|nr:MaoC family dehydratase [Chitinophaga polysaccharea]TWF45277.1 acyl dehydratase [Chitinophaga polysaccharea]